MRPPSPIVLAKLGLLLSWISLALQTASAQWATQTIQLQPGWNAVYLEVQPQPADCNTVFANLPVESVWGWNRRFSPVQFVQDANTLVPAAPDWLVYLPPASSLTGGSSLFTLEGGKCYLIKLAANAQPRTWAVQGQPSLRKTEWVPDSFNLVGFSLDRTNPPAFQTFFSTSPAHATNAAYRLVSNGIWAQVPDTTLMNSGEAFWIRCTGASDYQGPLSLTVPFRTGLTYGRALVEQTITIQNASANPRTILITLQPSASPPVNVLPALAGPVPLSYWTLDQANNVGGWFPLSGTVAREDLRPGQSVQVRLAVRRSDMAPYSGTNEALYQSSLEIRDAGGSSRLVIPVSAAGFQTAGSTVSFGTHQPKGSSLPPLHAGLWIGTVILNQVNQPASTSPNAPTNTASGFQFRLLVHLDSSGRARLLQRILQMWKQGTYKPDPNDPTKQVVDEPGRFVLITDESLILTISGLTGSALRDDQPVGRRFSTAAFSFRTPVLMAGNGDFGTDSSIYSSQIVLDYDDPLNPFKHKYHPDHDNFDPRFLQRLPEGQESFTVTRQVQLTFTSRDPDGLVLAGWGDTQLGGIYRETITGLHKQPLLLAGTFRLQQASRVAILNDGN
jgi:hypothetical protein